MRISLRTPCYANLPALRRLRESCVRAAAAAFAPPCRASGIAGEPATHDVLLEEPRLIGRLPDYADRGRHAPRRLLLQPPHPECQAGQPGSPASPHATQAPTCPVCRWGCQPAPPRPPESGGATSRPRAKPSLGQRSCIAAEMTIPARRLAVGTLADFEQLLSQQLGGVATHGAIGAHNFAAAPRAAADRGISPSCAASR